MLIAIDYGKTYDRDPALFDKFIVAAKAAGHEVVCVTLRSPAQPTRIPCEVIYTSGDKKQQHMARLGRRVDIWIDDWPETIV
jgi:hypothetical protein